MEEIWKDIKDYEGLYQVSNYGRIKSLKRIIKMGNHSCLKQEKILALNERGKYLAVKLQKEKHKKNYPVHRLVAMAFIQNPNNLPVINHIDGNKLNNRVENLEWCTPSQNLKHAYKIGLIKVGIAQTLRGKDLYKYGVEKNRKPVKQFTLDGEYIRTFKSIAEANRIIGKGNRSRINDVCKGLAKKSMGYFWEYAEKK